MIKSDYLIIGSGIAGLKLALKVAQTATVSLITKKKLSDSCTQKAQGGIACVIDKSDTFQEHIQDTLTSGAGLCNKDMVTKMVNEAPDRLNELIKLGVNFTKKENNQEEFDLGLEGGHSKRRILHTRDLTGKEIENCLITNILKNKNITIFENHTAIDLIINKDNICLGAYVFANKQNSIETFQAKITALACGGAGKTYLYTSNPDISTGDGIAMAYRVGADIANMEFVQFHPTCLYRENTNFFLISEAVRGEGAILRLKDGSQFMHKYSQKKELAPRDIVARAIDNELKTRKENYVYLDITSKNKNFLIKRFPNIYTKCLEYGIDMEKDMIPVTPAAHFFCGGVKIDVNGRTNIKNLYALGETACSGIHGANRLASNSLLEAIVYADRVYKDSLKFLNKKHYDLPSFSCQYKISKESSFIHMQECEEVRHISWNYLNISRSNENLIKAKKKINTLTNKVNTLFENSPITIENIELRNITCIADLIVNSAIQRKESRGLHYNINYPTMLPVAKDTIINIKDSLV
ncbi:MAG: L-aspartate oxidase [Endomicrobium sp.]|jgi:L-aspartate oxidase|nr:L-aspartate oxidase [Endomicrobium sp.]